MQGWPRALSAGGWHASSDGKWELTATRLRRILEDGGLSGSTAGRFWCVKTFAIYKPIKNQSTSNIHIFWGETDIQVFKFSYCFDELTCGKYHLRYLLMWTMPILSPGSNGWTYMLNKFVCVKMLVTSGELDVTKIYIPNIVVFWSPKRLLWAIWWSPTLITRMFFWGLDPNRSWGRQGRKGFSCCCNVLKS